MNDESKSSDVFDGSVNAVPCTARLINDENAAINGSKGVLETSKKSTQPTRLHCNMKYSKSKQNVCDSDLPSIISGHLKPGISGKKRPVPGLDVDNDRPPEPPSTGKRRQRALSAAGEKNSRGQLSQLSSSTRALSTSNGKRAPFVVPAKSWAVSYNTREAIAAKEAENDCLSFDSLASVGTKPSDDHENSTSDSSTITVSEDRSFTAWSLDDFDVKDHVLGKGKFGRVHRAQEKKSKEIVALKVLSKSQLLTGSSELLLLRREVEIQARCVLL